MRVGLVVEDEEVESLAGALEEEGEEAVGEVGVAWFGGVKVGEHCR